MTRLGWARQNRFALVVYAVVCASSLIFIWANRFLPMQDYPDWLFQGYIFSSSVRGEPLPGYEITGYAVPNILSTLVVGASNLLVSPETSGKLFLTMYILVFALGSLYFLRSAGARLCNPVCYLPLLLMVNDPFFHGYINYVLSFGVLLIGMGYVLSRRSHPETLNPWVIMVVSLVIYFSHATSFLCWLIFTGVFALTGWGRRYTTRLLVGLAPSLVLLALYAVGRLRGGIPVTFGVAGGFRPLSHLSYKASTGISQISVFHRFYPFFDMQSGFMRLLPVLNMVFCLSIILVCLYWLATSLRGGKWKQALTLAALLYFVLFAIGPSSFAGIFDPGQRFLYPALWLVFASLAARPGLPGGGIGLSLARLLILALVVIQGVFLHGHAATVSGAMESVWNEFRSAELDDDFQVVYESTFDYEGRFRQELYDLPVLRLPSHAPLDRLHYYLSIERGIHTPIFQTGLISEAGAPPPLRSASSLEAMKRYPEQLVIVGEPRGNSFIAGLLKRTYEVESEHGYFIVLRKASRERPASGSGG